LRAHAEKHNLGKILFNHKVVDFNDEGDAVLVHVETGDGRQLVYRAHTYLAPVEARLWVLHAFDASL
jgi:2-polyprenyl-6-methoxyphenol hydroxylase-like FAD-dependent oxidoreductase